jgi:hypothetical protein
VDRARAIDRARDLERLTQSPEPAEAELARTRLAEHLSKHGLTPDDVAEAVTVQADPQRDPHREWVAALASALRGCRLVVHRELGLGFRGRPDRVRAAGELYAKLLREGEESIMPAIAPWFVDQSRMLWRIWWWDAFAAKVSERFSGWATWRPPSEAPARSEPCEPAPSPSSEAPAHSSTAEAVQACVKALAYHINLKWLEEEARRSGRAAADRVSLGEDRLVLGG